jgi:hypothetical protein
MEVEFDSAQKLVLDEMLLNLPGAKAGKVFGFPRLLDRRQAVRLPVRAGRRPEAAASAAGCAVGEKRL